MNQKVSLTQDNFNRMLLKVAELSKRLDALEARPEPKPEPELESKTKTSRKTALPTSWLPDDKHYELAKQLRVRCDTEAAAFRAHAEATGRAMKDWDAAFRMWLMNAPRFGGSSAAPQLGGNAGKPAGSRGTARWAE
jgi:hypothetical protein